MRTKLIFAAALLALSAQAMATEQASHDMIKPYIALTGCSQIPPNGYVVVATHSGNSFTNCGGSQVGGYVPYIVYESYFDKPVGTQMSMCQGPGPVPNGWYQVGYVATNSCYYMQTRALLIQRYE
jgi:hypothetical protein